MNYEILCYFFRICLQTQVTLVSSALHHYKEQMIPSLNLFMFALICIILCSNSCFNVTLDL